MGHYVPLSFTQSLYVCSISILALVQQQFLFFARSYLPPPLLDLWLKQSTPASSFLEVRNHSPGKPHMVPNFSRASAGKKSIYLTSADAAFDFLLLDWPKNYFLSCCIFFPYLCTIFLHLFLIIVFIFIIHYVHERTKKYYKLLNG